MASWLEFLVSCFSSKVPPPTYQYFKNHYEGDGGGGVHLVVRAESRDPEEDAPIEPGGSKGTPGKRRERIVKIEETSRLANYTFKCHASTLRYFSRSYATPSSPGAPIEIFGLGEVCTSPAHSGLGLSTYLISETLPDRAVLHCSNVMYRGYYAKLGFAQCRPIEYVTVEIPRGGDDDDASPAGKSYHIKNVSSPRDSHAKSSRYASYILPKLKRGVTRDPEYYARWVSLDGDRFSGNYTAYSSPSDGSDGEVLAWCVLRASEDGDLVNVRDYGYAGECDGDGGGGEGPLIDMIRAYSPSSARYRVPSLAYDEIISPEKRRRHGVVGRDVDDGWMYKGQGLEDFWVWDVDGF